MSNNAQPGTGNTAAGARAATNDAANGMSTAFSTATQSAMACNAKALEFARINANASFDYASKLFGVKSPAEFMELSSQHARQQFEVLSAQSKEIAALSQKAMLEAAAPLKAGAAKMFQGPPA